MTQSLLSPQTKKDTSREIARFDPFEALSPIGLTFGRLFDDFWGRRVFDETDRLLAPAVDVVEDENRFVITTELPGLKKEDVKIEFANGVLSVSGEKRAESEKKGKSFHRMERRYGSFYRALTLPSGANIDAAEAEMKDGILELRLPKREEAKPKTVKVK